MHTDRTDRRGHRPGRGAGIPERADDARWRDAPWNGGHRGEGAGRRDGNGWHRGEPDGGRDGDRRGERGGERDGEWDGEWDKVTGRARFAAEYSPRAALAYAVPVQATIARGEVRNVDSETILTLPGMLAVLWHGNAPGLGVPEDSGLALFQSPKVAYRGQFVAAVVAETLETAYEAAARVRVDYAAEPHDVVLRADHPRAYRAWEDAPGEDGREAVERALREARVSLDLTYTTPAYHHNPLEPHSTVAVWEDQGLVIYDSCPGAAAVRDTLAELFTLPPSLVRVITPDAGVGYGGAATTRPQTVLAAIAAQVTGRPVQVTLTRRQMFAVTGYRTPLVQRVRLGADGRGRLVALGHDVVEQTSTTADPAAGPGAAGGPGRPVCEVLYDVPLRHRTHTVVPLDVPAPSWSRTQGDLPGVFALESAIDELAAACGLDPIELRLRNLPEADRPGSAAAGLAACLRAGAERFGWAGRDPAPGVRRDGRWLVGTGVAAAAYPVAQSPAEATVRLDADGRFRVRLAAPRMRPEERAALTTIAAVVLGVTQERVEIELGGEGGAAAGPPAPAAAGGDEPEDVVRWGMPVVRACEALAAMLGEREAHPGVPLEARARADAPDGGHAFGAQFAEARVNLDTGEVRVPRLLGVFTAGSAADADALRARFTGAMTLGLSMTLCEEGELDERWGGFLNQDLSHYLLATFADAPDVAALLLPGDGPAPDPAEADRLTGLGTSGTAAAIANAVHHATGIRVRDLPIRLDALVGRLPTG